MDKIWYRNPSKLEVIGRFGGDEKTTDHAEATKVKRLKNSTWNLHINTFLKSAYNHVLGENTKFHAIDKISFHNLLLFLNSPQISNLESWLYHIG
mgnify:CR=1 FL=1